MAKKPKTQEQKILDFLKTGKELTSDKAYVKWGVSRLPARIFDLREKGYTIYSNRKRVVKYSRTGPSYIAYRMASAV